MSKKLELAKVDVVGSFLRPKRLKDAREDFKNQKITKDELTKIENEEITKLVEKEKKAGLKFFSDGEFRRSWWHLDFFWGFNGAEKIDIEKGYTFHDEVTRAESVGLTGKISGENHPFVEHFKFIKQFEDENYFARQTFPAPAQFLREFERFPLENVTKIYPKRQEFIDDIVKAYRTVIKDLYDAGARSIQLDDCTWGLFVDKNFQKTLISGNFDFEKAIAENLDINNRVIADWPEDLLITTHVCRGNYHSTYAGSGAYDKVAEGFFGKENVDAYYLEYDTKRAGGFEPLKYVSGNKKVVLGLLTSKFAKLENKEEIKNRIKEASKYIPLDRISISTQCGFASTEEGNILTEEEQWKKIAHLFEIAKEVF